MNAQKIESRFGYVMRREEIASVENTPQDVQKSNGYMRLKRAQKIGVQKLARKISTQSKKVEVAAAKSLEV